MPKDKEFNNLNTPPPGHHAMPWGVGPPWYLGDHFNYMTGEGPPYAIATPNNYPYGYGYPYDPGFAPIGPMMTPPNIGHAAVHGTNRPASNSAYLYPDSTYVEIADLDGSKGYTAGYKDFFNTPHPALFSRYGAPNNMTVKEMIEQLGGDPKKAYLCEAIPSGIGIGMNGMQPDWIRGQVVFGDGDDGKKKLGELGWTAARSENGVPVRLVLGKGRRKG